MLLKYVQFSSAESDEWADAGKNECEKLKTTLTKRWDRRRTESHQGGLARDKVTMFFTLLLLGVVWRFSALSNKYYRLL